MIHCEENPQEVAGNGGEGGGITGAGEAIPPSESVDPKPTGEVVEITDVGGTERFHYRSFEYFGIKYQLEDFVYLAPDVDENNVPVRRPDVAIIKGEVKFSWPEDALSAVTRLENVAHDSLGTEHKKYKQKILSLAFNLEKSTVLARRLLNKELEPSVILNMTPVELKEGFTAEENKALEPEKSKPMEMTDARCKKCNEKAWIVDSFTAGGSRDRYQLECSSCGCQWYASHDAIYSLTVDASVVGNVGTAPWATAKFEDVRRLRSRDNREKSSPDIFQKKTTPYVLTLETQKSFRGKAKAKEANATAD